MLSLHDLTLSGAKTFNVRVSRVVYFLLGQTAAKVQLRTQWSAKILGAQFSKL
jgi:hypothetical protein